jgi:AcrR family transcriptional regulator
VIHASTRKTAGERREEILDAAVEAFAERGLHGTSTDDIARRAGVSQPYLFRLYGTKKDLFLATVARCLEETLALMRTAAGGKVGDDALDAIGDAYIERVGSNPKLLHLQMHSYAACDDPDVREVVRTGFGRLVEFAEQASSAEKGRITRFFGFGMLLNVIAAMGLLESDEPWARRLLEGCTDQMDES